MPNNDKILIIKKIDENRKKINKDKFIIIIRWILTIIILCLLIFYFIIIFSQKFLTYISGNILFSYYYNAHQRDAMLYIHSKLLEIYYDYFGLAKNELISEREYQETLINLSLLLQDSYFNFWDIFFYYNLDVGQEYNLILLYITTRI